MTVTFRQSGKHGKTLNTDRDTANSDTANSDTVNSDTTTREPRHAECQECPKTLKTRKTRNAVQTLR